MFQISWKLERPRHPGAPGARRRDGDGAVSVAMHRFQLNFWFNQCYNPHAHEYKDLHGAVFEWNVWSELLLPQEPKRFYVGHTLHRHWGYAFDPCLAIFHRRRLMAVFYEFKQIPVLLHERWGGVMKSYRRAQRCAFRVIRAHARTRWLAAVRIILLLGLEKNSDIVDNLIIAELRDWDVEHYARRYGSSKDCLDDASQYIMEESVERALKGCLVTYPSGAGSKCRMRD